MSNGMNQSDKGKEEESDSPDVSSLMNQWKRPVAFGSDESDSEEEVVFGGSSVSLLRAPDAASIPESPPDSSGPQNDNNIPTDMFNNENLMTAYEQDDSEHSMQDVMQTLLANEERKQVAQQEMLGEAAKMVSMLRDLNEAKKRRMDQAQKSRKDGSHSTTPGPAPCGLKHWYQGKEVDFVCAMMNKVLGFDFDCNPILVARDFVAKHNFNPHSTDNSALVSQIAEKIRKLIEEKGGESHGEDLESLIDNHKVGPYADSDETAIIRPFAGENSVRGVFNRKTGKVELIHYQNDSDQQAVTEKVEALKKAKDAAKKKKESEMQAMRDRIKAMQRDRQAEQGNKASSGPLKSLIPNSKRGGMATLQNLGSASIKPKEDWSEAYAMRRFKERGPVDFQHDMDDAGFTENEQKRILGRLQLYILTQSLMRGSEDGGMGDLYGGEDEEDDIMTLAQGKYKKKKGVKAFAGEGHKLQSASVAVSEQLDQDENNDDDDAEEVQVDESQPTTQIRIRVPNQSPVVATFNLTHTIGDIRRHINRKILVEKKMYHLQLMMRPPKRLSDATQTIQSVGLQKATVMIVEH